MVYLFYDKIMADVQVKNRENLRNQSSPTVQFMFCTMPNSFLNVLSTVSPILSHARKFKPAERRDRSEYRLAIFALYNRKMFESPTLLGPL
jgi:hypothetical protein